VATWRDFVGFIDRTYKYEILNDDLLKLVFNTSNLRTQLVFLEHATCNSGAEWFKVNSPIGKLTPQQVMYAARRLEDMVVGGIIINRLFDRHLQVLRDALPLISVVCIVLILSSVVALSKGAIAKSGMIIFGVVILHNLLGYLLGLLAARAAGFNSAQRRAIMIEVGMQNSALGATLGTKYFSPEAALPSAIFSVWHNISGALVANICTWWDKRHGK